MKTLLSIDWDYFVPEDIADDFGQIDAPFFVDQSWRHRYSTDLEQRIITSGEEVGWWDRFPFRDKITTDKVYVTDSHVYSYVLSTSPDYGFPTGFDQTILVDAHHDLWEQREVGVVDCGNWLGLALAHTDTSAYWKQAEWSKEYFSLPEVWEGVVFEEYPMDVESIDAVHIVRSGSWTAPWLDGNFIGFVEDSGLTPARMKEETDRYPLRERWTERMLGEIREYAQQKEDKIAGLEALKSLMEVSDDGKKEGERV